MTRGKRGWPNSRFESLSKVTDTAAKKLKATVAWLLNPRPDIVTVVHWRSVCWRGRRCEESGGDAVMFILALSHSKRKKKKGKTNGLASFNVKLFGLAVRRAGRVCGGYPQHPSAWSQAWPASSHHLEPTPRSCYQCSVCSRLSLAELQ